jgi:hypothetical protein
MKCAKCDCSVFKRPFKRVNPKGEKGIWWCEVCLLKNEPELYKNEMEDESPVEKTLKEICYGQKR